MLFIRVILFHPNVLNRSSFCLVFIVLVITKVNIIMVEFVHEVGDELNNQLII